MFRFLFRTMFRFVRLVVRVGLLTGIGFAAVKLVQSRRAGSPLGGGAEWTAAPPRRSDMSRPAGETPLVEPHMFRGVSLNRSEQETADGQRATVASPRPTQPAKPTAPAAEVATPPAKARSVAKATKATAKATKGTAKKAAKRVGTKKAAAKKVAGAKAANLWVDPQGAICPASHPVKAKLSSRIYHLPGMTAYNRTSPDRCYRDEAAAEAEGLRKAKR